MTWVRLARHKRSAWNSVYFPGKRRTINIPSLIHQWKVENIKPSPVEVCPSPGTSEWVEWRISLWHPSWMTFVISYLSLHCRISLWQLTFPVQFYSLSQAGETFGVRGAALENFVSRFSSQSIIELTSEYVLKVGASSLTNKFKYILILAVVLSSQYKWWFLLVDWRDQFCVANSSRKYQKQLDMEFQTQQKRQLTA